MTRPTSYSTFTKEQESIAGLFLSRSVYSLSGIENISQDGCSRLLYILHVCVCAHARVCTCVWCMFFIIFIFYIPLGNSPNCCTPSQVSSLLQVTLQKECCIIPRCFSDASTPVGVFDMTTEHGSVLSLCYKLSGSLSICCFFAQPLCTQFKHMCWFRLAVQWSCLHSRFVTFFILPGITNGCTVGYLHGCAFHWFVACWSMGWMYFCLGSVIVSSYVGLPVLSFTSAFRVDSSNRGTCYPPVWNLSGFPFPFSSLALWPSPCLVIFLLMVHSFHFFSRKFSTVSDY